MKLKLEKAILIKYVEKQLCNFFDCNEKIYDYIDMTLQRVEKCFERNKNKYYRENGEILFSPFHSGQYSIFLYYLANSISKMDGNADLATKVYYLNKVLHSIDWYYEIELPEYFGVEHPLGSILGRAIYNNGFFFYQGCTVGGNKGKYPTIGRNVIMYSNSTIIGDATIGNNVLVSSGTLIKGENIPNNCLVFGKSPNLVIKEKDENYMLDKIGEFWNV